ncbi:PAS domain S-box protein [uncultured Draconibacterium sp.]|uniref:PAS domain S-box protein n=1 Tax=uncultured Draconibacterium sp. TaxID=1573823 RepID=UPI0025CDCB27|nr:PAS domain S-box protein [uncultured Draconibacterium sp.]
MEHYLKTELYELLKKDDTIFDFIQQGSLDGLWYWDLENAEDEWMSPGFWEVLGYNPKEMPHKASAWQDIINPDDLKVALDNFHKHVANPNRPYDQEVRYTHKNGSIVWIRCRGLVIRDNENKAVRMIGTHQDITQLKRSEQDLKKEHDEIKKNEELYRFLTENTADVIRYQTPEGRFSYISPNIKELSGYTADEYLKFDSLENVVPEDHNLLKQVVEKFKQNEDNVRVEYRLFHKNGSVIWVESRIKAIRNENGEVISLLSSTNDITQKKATEQKLKLSNTRYKQLVETAVDAIYLIDEQGIVIDTNHQATLMLEKSKEEIIGQNVEVIDPNFPVDAFLAFWNPIPYDETRIFETTHIDKAGRVVPIEISGKKYKLDGKTYYYGIARDISERKIAENKIKQSQAKFKSYVNNAPDGIFIANEKGKYLEVNPAACRITGYSNEELLKLSIPELLQKEELEKGARHFKEVQEKGVSNEEIGFVTKSGENRFWHVAAVKLSDTRFLGFVKDTTEQRLARQKLQNSEKRLKEAQKMASMGYYEYNIETEEQWWSEELYHILEFDANKPSPTIEEFSKRLDQEDIDNLNRLLQHVISTGESDSLIYKIHMPSSGKYKYISTKAEFYTDEFNTKYVKGTLQDVTERIKAEEALIESEEKFRNLYEKSPFGIAICQMIRNEENEFVDFLHVQLNESVNEQTGFDIEQLAGKKASEIVDEKTLKELVRLYGEVISDSKTINYEQYFDVYDRTLGVTAFPLIKDYFIINFINISERKDAEEKIRLRELHLSSLVENPVGYIIYRTRFNRETGQIEVVQVSPSCTEILSISEEDRENFQQWFQYVHPEDLPKLMEASNAGINPPFKLNIEVRYNHPVEGLKWLEIRANGIPYGDDPNMIEYANGIILDITEQKHAEEKIKASEAKFRGVFEESNVGIALGSAKGTVIEVNEEYLKITGYTREEFVNLNYAEITHPDDLVKELPLFEQLHKGEIDHYRLEKRLLMKNGEYRWLDAAISCRRNAKGEVDLTIALVIDIHEGKRANEIVNTFFDQPMNMHLIGTIQGEILKVNKGWEETLGYTKEETLGKNIMDFIHPDDAESTVNELKDLESGKTTFYFENRYKHKNGNYINLAWSAIFNTSGKLLHGVAKDITQQKAYHEQLLKSEENYKTLAENAKHLIIRHRPDGEITYANKFAFNYLGVPEKELIGLDIKELIGDSAKAEHNQQIKAFRENMDTNYRHHFELELERGAEASRYLDVMASPVISAKKLDSILIAAYDITERKQAEQKILDQNEEYEALNEELRQTNDELYNAISREEEINDRFNKAMEATSDGLFDWNLKTNEIYYSPRWKAMLGYQDYELPNDFSIWETLTDPEDVKRSWEMQNELINKKRDKFRIEFKMRHKKGHWVEILSRADAFFDENGKATRIVGTHTDITERKIAENKLRQSEEKLRLAINNSPLGICLNSMQGQYISVNKAYEKIVGYTEKELLEMSFFDITHPDYLENNHELFDTMASNKAPGFAIDKKYIRKDGTEVDVRIHAGTIQDSEGEPLFGMAFVEDVSWQKQAENKLKNSEKRFKQAEQIGKVGHWEYYVDNKTFWASDEAKLMYGFDLEQEFVSLEDAEKQIPDSARTNKALMDLIEKDIPYDIDFEIINRKTGERISIHSIAIAERNANGNPVKVNGVIHNITERLQFENDLLQAKEQAEESNRLKSEFLHNMSHEIRTPMNGIMGFANLLEEPETSEEQRKYYTSIIQNSSNQLLRIIDDILEISILETKQQQLVNKRFLLNDFVMELFAIFDLKAKDRKLPFYVKKGLADEESAITCDKTKLNKIISNLLENAFKFTSEGFVELGYYPEKESIVLYVKDTGTGISKENRERIFKRFSQENKGIAQSHGGLGLGLSIAKENAQLLGGEIAVDSEKGKGSTFKLILPFKTELEEPADSNKQTTGKSRTKKQHCKILVAEDEEVNYLYLETILKSVADIGCEVIHAKNGKEAVDACEKDRDIDLILMDIKMPVMDGYEATQKVKKICPDVPVIAQTAYSTEADKNLTLQHGCDGFISKPIEKESILELLVKFAKLK